MVKEVLTSVGDKGGLGVDLENQPRGKTVLNITVFFFLINEGEAAV